MQEKREHALRFLRGLLILLVMAAAFALPMAAQAANTISGSVYNDGDNNLGTWNTSLGDYAIGSGFVVGLYTSGGTEVLNGVTHITATTDSNGAYMIQAPAAGSYMVKVKPAPVSSGYGVVGADAQSVMLSGNDFTGKNLSVRGTGGNLSGKVSKQDNTSILGGIRVYLTGTTAGGSPINVATTTVAGTGYSFANLPAGSYTLSSDQTDIENANFAYLNAVGGGAVPVFSLSATMSGVSVGGKDFYIIEPNPTGITGFVYNDQNEDGQLTNGLDMAMKNIEVSLFYSDGITPVKTLAGIAMKVNSGVDGSYQFGNLAPRDYVTKTLTIPTGFTVTGSKQGQGATFNYINISLSTNASTQNNFFVALTGTNPALSKISGAAFGITGNNILGSSSVINGGESVKYTTSNMTTAQRSLALPNMIVTLYRSNGAGGWNQISQRPTDANGDYSYKGLEPDTYKVTLIPNSAITGAYQFVNDTDGKLGSQAPCEIVMTPMAGTTLSNQNFWFAQPRSMAANAYAALAFYGDRSVGGTNAAGVFAIFNTGTYTLYEEDGITPTSYSPLTTGIGDSGVNFPGVVPGIYVVKVTGLPPALSVPDYWFIISNSSYAIIPVAGDTNPAMTVSGAAAANSGIQGTIFVDTDGDGLSDIPLHKSVINLYYIDGSGPTMGSATLKNANGVTMSSAGNFVWRDMPKGKYRIPSAVNIQIPTEYKDQVELDAIYDGTAWITNPTFPVFFDATGGSILDVKIRYKKKIPGYYITGRIWEDVNNNGVINVIDPTTNGVYDFPVDGIELELLDSSGIPTGITTTTDMQGKYTFAGLSETTYSVRIKNFNGYSIFNDVATKSFTFSGPPGVYPETSFLVAGSTNTDPASGIGGAGAQNSGIAGTIFIDLNGNDLPDLATETAYYGGSSYINLAKVMSDGVTKHSFTGSIPLNYRYYNLGSGKYELFVNTFGSGSNYVVRKDTDPGTGIGRIHVTIPSGAIIGSEGNNFQYGRVESGGIAGALYLDVNGNNALDANDMKVSLSGTTLEWYDLILNRATPQSTQGVAVDGTYVFNNSVMSGSHWIMLKNLPSGYELITDADGAATPADVANPLGTILVGVTPGGKQNQDFLIKRTTPVELSGRLYVDGDYDNIYNEASPSPDDSVIPGATVRIYNSLSQLVTTQTTGADGMYHIYNLPDGIYTITVDTTTVSATLKIAGNAAGTTNNTFAANVNGGQKNGQNVWFNDKTDSGVAGQVVIDLDNDGVAKINADKTGDMSAGAGIKINFYLAGTSTLVKTVYTNDSGSYRYVPAPNGSYDIEIDTSTLPSGYNLYGNSAGQIGAGAVKITNITLNSSMETGKNFLLAGDSNNSPNLGPNALTTSGIKGKTTQITQSGAALSGVTLSLIDLGSGKEIARAISNGSGEYQFLNLKKGNYQVVAAQSPAGYSPIGDVDTVNYPNPGELKAIVVTNGVVGQDIWLGLTSTVGIQGTVTYTNSGTSPGTPTANLLAGISVELYLSTDLVNPFQTQITDTTGTYKFINIPTVSYVVKIKDTELTTKGFNVLTPGTPGSYTINNLPAAGVIDKHFILNGLYTLGDLVWKDVDGSNTYSGGDTGIAGVEVKLTWSGVDGVFDNTDDVVFSTPATTTSAGTYSFVNLPSGNYKVAIDLTKPANVTALSGVEFISDTVLTGNTNPQTKTIGTANITNADFGFRVLGSISGKVSYDHNLDGAYANPPDTPVASWTITLTPSGGTAVTTTTDANGDYTFTGLPYGNYTVTTTVPTNYVFSYDGDDPLTGAQAGTPNSIAVTLNSAAPTPTDKHFGYKSVTGVSGIVSIDVDGNGAKNIPADLGMNGVTVEIYQSGTSTLLLTTTTNASGAYNFASVPPGSWDVKVKASTLPAGYVFSYDADGATTGNGAVGITVAAGETSKPNIDFGYKGSASISGSIFKDLDGNGTFGGSDIKVGAGLKVTLSGGSGFVSRDVYTDALGNYTISNLSIYPDYKITVDNTNTTLLGGYTVPSVDPVNGTINPTLVNVPMAVLTTVDVMIDKDFGLMGAAKIKGRVFLDNNDDGLYAGTPNDTAQSGVKVQLWLSGAQVAIATTDANGEYALAAINSTAYEVRIDTTTLPLGVKASFDYDDVHTVNGWPATANKAAVTTPATGDALDIHFGYLKDGGVTGIILNDVNAVHTFSAPGQLPICSVPVALLDAGGLPVMMPDGVTPVTAHTDGTTGEFTFRNLDHQKYQVKIDFGPNCHSATMRDLEPSYDSNNNGLAQANMVAGVHLIQADLTSVSALTPTEVHAGYMSGVGEITIIKRAAKGSAKIGEIVPYSITVINNNTSGEVKDLVIEDLIPAGFKYVAGSARLDGEKIADPTGGRPLRFAPFDIGNSSGSVATPGERKLTYFLIVGAGVTPGDYVNTAVAMKESTGKIASNTSSATVKVVGDPLFDDSLIFGKVYIDANGNGSQDGDEQGLGGVKLVTGRGEVITTDTEGRYHLTDVSGGRWERGANFILKLDVRSLPQGYKVISDNPIVVRLSPGLPSRVNFGIQREGE